MSLRIKILPIAVLMLCLAPVSQSQAGIFDFFFNMDDFFEDMDKMNKFVDKKKPGPGGGSKSNQGGGTGGGGSGGSGAVVYDLVVNNNTGSNVGGGNTGGTGAGLVLSYPPSLKITERFARCAAASFSQNLFPVYAAGAAKAMPGNARPEKFAVDLPSGTDLANHSVDCSDYITPQATTLDGGTKYAIEGSSRFVCFGGSWVLAESSCIAKVVPAAVAPRAPATTDSRCVSSKPASCSGGGAGVGGYAGVAQPTECCCEPGVSGNYQWAACQTTTCTTYSASTCTNHNDSGSP